MLSVRGVRTGASTGGAIHYTTTARPLTDARGVRIGARGRPRVVASPTRGGLIQSRATDQHRARGGRIGAQGRLRVVAHTTRGGLGTSSPGGTAERARCSHRRSPDRTGSRRRAHHARGAGSDLGVDLLTVRGVRIDVFGLYRITPARPGHWQIRARIS